MAAVRSRRRAGFIHCQHHIAKGEGRLRIKALVPPNVPAGGVMVGMREVGRVVHQGDPLALVSTPQGLVSVPAPAAGMIAEWRAGPGEPLAPGREIALIDQPTGPLGGYFAPFDLGRTLLFPVLERTTAVPQVSAMLDVDMTNTLNVKTALGTAFKQQTGAPLGLMPFLIYAAIEGLRAVPRVNASMMGMGLWIHDRVHMGFTVATPRGTQAPVLRDADQKSLGRLAAEMHDLAVRARAGLLRPEELMISTFAVSNPGSLGLERDVPVVLPPHVATMSCGAIVRRPAVVGDTVTPRPLMNVSLSLDHRALDADDVTTFLRHVKACLEKANYVV